MVVQTVTGMFDCNGRMASGRSYFYVMMARDVDGPMYIKLGRSNNPLDRVGQVQTGCPFPIIKAMMVKCLSVQQARKVERLMHAEFSEHAVRGEWFRFEWEFMENRKLVMLKLETLLSEHLREWKIEIIDVEIALNMQRELVNNRKRRSREAIKARHAKITSTAAFARLR